MKTGIIMTAALENFDKEAKHIRSIGYDCVDLQQYIDPESVFYSLPDDVIISAKRTLNNNGLTVSQIHGPWACPPPNNTEEECNFWLEKARKAIHASFLFKCKYLVVHPLMPDCYFDRRDPQRVFETNYSFFDRLLIDAKRENVTVCLENMPFDSLLLSRPEEILGFVKEFDSPYFKICLDTGHCNVHGISPADMVRKIGKDYLAVLHIHDNNGDGDNHLKPFEGSINWRDFSYALKEIGFDGVASLETAVNVNGSEVADGVAFSKEIALFQSVRSIADGSFG